MSGDVRLRALVESDAKVMATVLADGPLYRFMGGGPPTDEELSRRYAALVRGHSADGRESWINEVVELDGRPIGYVQATIGAAGDVAEIAWVIGVPWQGRGYGRRAVGLLRERLADRGVRQIIAHIHPDHVASQRVARAVGMEPTDVDVDGETRWMTLGYDDHA